MEKENIFFLWRRRKREKEKEENVILLISQGVQVVQCGQGSKVVQVDGQDCQEGWSKGQFGQQGVRTAAFSPNHENDTTPRQNYPLIGHSVIRTAKMMLFW